MIFLLKCIYLMMPAYFANMAPVFAKKLGILKFLEKPVDGGKKWQGKEIFGTHKTWRGFAAGIIMAVLIAWLQFFLYQFTVFKKISLLNYATVNLWLLGFLFGFGALFGDLIKSFFKRRFGIAPGKPWPPFDQIDFVIGALIFIAPVYLPSWQAIIVILIISPFLHVLANISGYFLKIKNNKW